MPDYAGEPVTISTRDLPAGVDNMTASGAVDIYTEDQSSHLVAAAGMGWDGEQFTYDWDTTGVDPGDYAVKVTVTPTGGLGSFEWVTVTLLDRPAPPPTPSPFVCQPWARPEDVPDAETYDQAKLVEYLQFASETLFLFTGSQWPGACTDRVWPGNRRRAGGPAARQPADAAPRWATVACGCGADEFGCHRVPSIPLPGRPVVEILEVAIGGEVLDADEYEVQNGYLLVRLAGDDGSNEGWPCCQRADLEDGAEGTFSILYRWGAAPPVGGKLSAVSLAAELAKASRNDKDCRLPKRVTAITRQGVTVAVLDPLTLFEKGQTGLADVDLWVGSIKAGKGRRMAVFAHPETILRAGNRRRRVT